MMAFAYLLDIRKGPRAVFADLAHATATAAVGEFDPATRPACHGGRVYMGM